MTDDEAEQGEQPALQAKPPSGARQFWANYDLGSDGLKYLYQLLRLVGSGVPLYFVLRIVEVLAGHSTSVSVSANFRISVGISIVMTGVTGVLSYVKWRQGQRLRGLRAENELLKARLKAAGLKLLP